MLPSNQIQFYNFIAPLYAFINLFLIQKKKRLVDKLHQLPPGNLLEVGVGIGTYLKDYKRHKITAIDHSNEMLRRARKKNNSNVLFANESIEEHLLSHYKYDYIVMSHVIGLLKNPKATIEACLSKLNDGGKLFVLNHFSDYVKFPYFYQFFSPIAKVFHFKSDIKTTDILPELDFDLEIEKINKWNSYWILTITKC